MLKQGWRHLKRGEACPVCGRGGEVRNPNTHCTLTADSAVVCCQKSGGMPHGGKAPFKQGAMGGYLYRVGESAPYTYQATPKKAKPKPPNFTKLFWSWRLAVNPARLEKYAQSLGVSAESLYRIGIGWGEAVKGRDGRTVIKGTTTPVCFPGTWLFPLKDYEGNDAGFRVRTLGGDKYSVRESLGDGVFIPTKLRVGEPLLLPEGPTSLAALLTLGINASGRPNNQMGARIVAGLAKHLKSTAVLLVGDNDERFDERLGRNVWPGREGAERCQSDLAALGVASSVVFHQRNTKTHGSGCKPEQRPPKQRNGWKGLLNEPRRTTLG